MPALDRVNRREAMLKSLRRARQDVSMRKAICIEFRGQLCHGHRIIDHRRDRLFQTIYFGTERRADSHAYRPDEGEYMAEIAKIILRELVDMSVRHSAQHGQ